MIIAFSACQSNNHSTTVINDVTGHSIVELNPTDFEAIQKLIKQMLIWTDTETSIDLLPVIADKKEEVYVGFDLDQHKMNLAIFAETNFFTPQFIENYNQIILTLDDKVKNKYFEPWMVGELPPFPFTNHGSPWCLCQDNQDWNLIEVKVLNLTKNEVGMEWSWGISNQEEEQIWEDIPYKFAVEKVNGQWKISYLAGFDLEDNTKF